LDVDMDVATRFFVTPGEARGWTLPLAAAAAALTLTTGDTNLDLCGGVCCCFGFAFGFAKAAPTPAPTPTPTAVVVFVFVGGVVPPPGRLGAVVGVVGVVDAPAPARERVAAAAVVVAEVTVGTVGATFRTGLFTAAVGVDGLAVVADVAGVVVVGVLLATADNTNGRFGGVFLGAADAFAFADAFVLVEVAGTGTGLLWLCLVAEATAATTEALLLVVATGTTAAVAAAAAAVVVVLPDVGVFTAAVWLLRLIGEAEAVCLDLLEVLLLLWTAAEMSTGEVPLLLDDNVGVGVLVLVALLLVGVVAAVEEVNDARVLEIELFGTAVDVDVRVSLLRGARRGEAVAAPAPATFVVAATFVAAAFVVVATFVVVGVDCRTTLIGS
jgi:hypothetical protein